jgi:hypothetical protein
MYCLIDVFAKWTRFPCGHKRGQVRQACWARDDGPKGQVLYAIFRPMREKEKKRGGKLGGLGCRGRNKRFSDQKERGGNWAKEFDF